MDEALKERLARQDAASRMFERNVVQPPPPKAAEPKPSPGASPPAPVAAPAPAAMEAARPPAVKPAAVPQPEKPAYVPPPPDVAPKAATPKPAASRTDLAAAKPTSAPEPAAPRLLSRVEPDFPTEAVRAGIDRGVVHARLTIDGGGSVTNVEIMDANPRRVFDRSVMRALGQWKFNEGAPGRVIESEVAFRK